MEKTKKKMGRPILLEDYNPDNQKSVATRETFEALMGIPFVTEEAVSDIFKVSISTLVRWIKKNYGLTFDELKAQKQGNNKLKLAGRQYELAMKGNVPMCIWLGKQWLGQKDQIEQKIDQTSINIVIDSDDKEL